MCGIAGIADRTGPVERRILERMAATMVHRGPDDEGFCMGEGSGPVWCGLAHRRLSIIDLEGGGQPIDSEDGNVRVVANGEIYNHRALRKELEERGHRFRTGSDSEVLVHLYEEVGPEMLEQLDGMFAFAVWDAGRGRMFLARDRFGKKPLFYRIAGDRLIFASTLEALLASGCLETPEIDPESLDLYLALQYIPAPWTILKGVRKLAPGNRLLWERGVVTVEPYFRPEPDPASVPATYEEAKVRLRELVESSVQRRLESDVPLGAFLSGGIDSSILVSVLARLRGDVRTFSIGFEESEFDERPFAEALARRYGTRHHVEVVRPDVRTILEELVRHFGEPFADSSALPTWVLARMTRDHVTVSLSGDGGDELFLGYDRYRAVHLANRIDTFSFGLGGLAARALRGALPASGPSGSRLRRIRRFADGLARSPGRRYLEWVSYFNRRARMELYAPALLDRAPGLQQDLPLRYFEESMRGQSSVDPMVGAAALDLVTYLPGDLLVKVDVSSMAHGLEVRCPFLDPELVAFATALPRSWKYGGGWSKRILRDAFASDLPPEILARGKVGFGVPIGRWLRTDLADLLRERVGEGLARRVELFRPETIGRLVDEHLSCRADHWNRLWSLLVLETWFRQVLD